MEGCGSGQEGTHSNFQNKLTDPGIMIHFLCSISQIALDTIVNCSTGAKQKLKSEINVKENDFGSL